jgi:hypothetical protein
MKRRIRAGEPARWRTMRDLGDPTLLEVQDSVLSHSRVPSRLRSSRGRRSRRAARSPIAHAPIMCRKSDLGIRRSVG